MNVLAAFLYSFFIFLTSPSVAEFPRVTHFQAPRYPELAWQSQVHGKVSLKILVYKDGRFGFTETPEGNPLLVSAAKENLCTWNFASHSTEDPLPLRSRYVELLGDALKIEPSPTDWLADVDAGFYVSKYLRAWAFEAQLRAYLREKFGNAWFTRKDAGSLLRELWSEGQKPTADELLREVTGEALELAAVADRIRESLAAV